MIAPLQLQNICNDTIVVNNTYKYLLAPNDIFLACSSGLTRHLVNDDFMKRKDYCVLLQLFPNLRIHDSDDLLGFWERGTELPRRSKREPVTVVTLTVLLGLGATGTGTGIASLVTSQQNVQCYHELNAAISQDVEDLREGMVLSGTVRNVIDFGAFVDIGVKHDGLVHISEMSDKFVKNPSEIVSVGDVVKVKVIKIDKERQKVGLSMKV